MKFSILTVLFLMFMFLQLTGFIEWSWWLISLPLVVQIWWFIMYSSLAEIFKDGWLSRKDKEQYLMIAHGFAWIPSIIYTVLVIWLAG